MITKYTLLEDDVSLKSKKFFEDVYIFGVSTNVEIEIDLLSYRGKEGKISRKRRLYLKSRGIVGVFHI